MTNPIPRFFGTPPPEWLLTEAIAIVHPIPAAMATPFLPQWYTHLTAMFSRHNPRFLWRKLRCEAYDGLPHDTSPHFHEKADLRGEYGMEVETFDENDHSLGTMTLKSNKAADDVRNLKEGDVLYA